MGGQAINNQAAEYRCIWVPLAQLVASGTDSTRTTEVTREPRAWDHHPVSAKAGNAIEIVDNLGWLFLEPVIAQSVVDYRDAVAWRFRQRVRLLNPLYVA